ncbi:hypothetical protein OAD53_04065 [Gammaproteobacteria bacterium]|nr:hypothetical protein [Gammaproteobacteria bacterium]
MNISVIIPTLDNPNNVRDVIKALNLQLVLPSEIVIVDSSSSDEISELTKSIKSQINITYKRIGRAYRFDRLLLMLKGVPVIKNFFLGLPIGRAFPGEASNYGVGAAKHEWVALLDATTIPNENWINDYCNIIKNKDVEVVLGNTLYLADTYFQKLLRASSFGAEGIETSPGSLIKKNDYLNGFKINEGVRSGGDVDWKNRVKESYKSFTPKNSYLVYPNLERNFFQCAKKNFIYSINGAVQDISHKMKDLYLLAILLFTLVLIPQWNAIVGWESSPYYIPHLTKVWLISIALIVLMSLLYNRIALSKSESSIFRSVHKIAIFIIISFVIYNWNGYFASWVEESVWYMPHITKIYVSMVCLASFLYRGIYFPLKNNISSQFLFPVNWFFAGVLGFFLDLVKAPGYILGTIFAPFLKAARVQNNRVSN